ncbi:hypothetical protein ACT9XH_00880 [Methanococcoides methylutens]
MIEIRAQPGPQHQFLESTADICFYGGAAAANCNVKLVQSSSINAFLAEI